MRALITGGAGFIGSHLAEELLARGDEVKIIDNLSTGSMNNISRLIDDNRFSYVIDTIMNEEVMRKLISECDIIYHLAAAVGVKLIIDEPIQSLFTNILGTHVILRLANSLGKKKVIIASTSEIYGKNGKVPYNEDDDRVLGPTTIYRWSYSTAKAVDEYMALAYFKQERLPIIIVRFFNTVGERQTGRYGMVIPRFIRQALTGGRSQSMGMGSRADVLPM